MSVSVLRGDIEGSRVRPVKTYLLLGPKAYTIGAGEGGSNSRLGLSWIIEMEWLCGQEGKEVDEVQFIDRFPCKAMSMCNMKGTDEQLAFIE